MSDVLAVVIKLPPEAMVPLLVGSAALLVLLFAGAALASWKQKSPGSSRIFGFAVALACTGYAAYSLSQIVPLQLEWGDNGHHYQFSFIAGSIAGFLAIVGGIMWRYAGQRWVGFGTALGIGAVLFTKPFIYPSIFNYEGMGQHTRGMTDPEHLAFLGPGLACAIAALIILRRPQR